MRYTLAKLIYLLRRSLPLYADDNSKIYTAYSAQILDKFSKPDLSDEERYAIFLFFAEHFIGDISAERMSAKVSTLKSPLKTINAFEHRLSERSYPRALIFLRKVKHVLSEHYGMPTVTAAPIDFNWSEALENNYTEAKSGRHAERLSIFSLIYWPYLIWRFFFPFKNTSYFAHAFRRHLLEKLMSKNISEADWLRAFERYSRLFKSPIDMEMLAEALKLRTPGRDLAFLEFVYRVRESKPKVLLYYRRLKIVLAKSYDATLPDYRGTDLTTIFFNPLEDKRRKRREAVEQKRNSQIEKARLQREQQKAKLIEAAAVKSAKRAKKREKLLEKSAKRREKTLKIRSQLSEDNKARAEKTIMRRAKLRETQTNKNIEKRRKTTNKTRTSSQSSSQFSSLLKFRLRFDLFRQFLSNLNSEQDVLVQLVKTETQSQSQNLKYISASKKARKTYSDLAVFCVTGRFDPYLDISILERYARIVILNQSSLSDMELAEKVRDYLGPYIPIECFSPSRLLIKPYTKDHQIVSDFSDQLAEKLMKQAFQNRATGQFLNSVLFEEYAVTLSDKLFRPAERFYSKRLFFETIPSDTPVFFNSEHDKAHLYLEKKNFKHIFIFKGAKLLGQNPHETPNDPIIGPRHWYKSLQQSFNQIQASMNRYISADEASKPAEILLVTHSRSTIHRNSAHQIARRLSLQNRLETIDVAPQADGNSPIHTASQSLERHLQTKIRAALHPIIQSALADMPINGFETNALTKNISSIVSRSIGLLLTQTALYNAVKTKFKTSKRSIAILVPGRYGENRTIARAFQGLGFPTIDVQLLFLSTMARYKAPITTHQTVIDSAAKDFYIRNFGLSEKNITVLGSIMRDKDVKHAREFGRANSLKFFGFSNDQTILTLACQPGFEAVTLEACRRLAKYILTRDDVTICIKLHPAQSPEHNRHLTEALTNTLPEDLSHRYRIIHKEAFWKIMPSTDILISYFSNVCLQACAFGTPVLSLPGGETRPEPDFETLGLARNVKTLDELSSHLDYLLNMSQNERAQEPPYQYLQNNPHMASSGALDKFASFAEGLLRSANAKQ